MSMDVKTFAGRCLHIMESFPWYANANTEINALAAALSPDTTKHDTTISTAPVGLRPGNRVNSPFTNQLLLEINKGKAGNLPNSVMAQTLQAASGPVNTVAPTITYVSGGGGAATVGATYASNTGTWQPPGATMTRQWLRNGANIAGSTGTTYVIAAADEGNTVACRITATNSQGSNSMASNGVAIPAP